MKKIAYLTLALGLLLSAFSCSKNGVIYDPEGNPCLSFPVEEMTVEPTEDGILTVELWRGNTNGELSVPVEILIDEEYADIITPMGNTFEFKNGQNKSVITFEYDSEVMEFNKSYDIDIELMNIDNVSPTGFGAITVSLVKPMTFTKIGTATITYSDFWGESFEATLYKANEVEGYYTIKDCYEEGYDFKFMVSGSTVTVPDQALAFYGEGYGPYAMLNAEATLTGDVLDILYELALPEIGYSWGWGFEETIQLPEGWNK